MKKTLAHRAFRRWLLWLGLALLQVPALAQPRGWVVQAFAPDADSSFVTLWDINDAGTIVGEDDGGGFVYRGAGLERLPAFNGLPVVPTSISNSGVIAGQYFVDNVGFQSVLFDGSAYTTVDVAGAQTTGLRRISRDGRYLTGTYAMPTGETGGFVIDRTTQAQYLLPRQTGGGPVLLQGVDAAGRVVGSIGGFDGGAIVWWPASGAPPQLYTEALGPGLPRFRGINDAGVIVGFQGAQGFAGTLDVGFTPIGLPGAESSLVYGVNNAGVLVGTSNFDALGISRGFIATPVPEPAAALLLAAGLAALGAARRFRR